MRSCGMSSPLCERPAISGVCLAADSLVRAAGGSNAQTPPSITVLPRPPIVPTGTRSASGDGHRGWVSRDVDNSSCAVVADVGPCWGSSNVDRAHEAASPNAAVVSCGESRDASTRLLRDCLESILLAAIVKFESPRSPRPVPRERMVRVTGDPGARRSRRPPCPDLSREFRDRSGDVVAGVARRRCPSTMVVRARWPSVISNARLQLGGVRGWSASGQFGGQGDHVPSLGTRATELCGALMRCRW